MIKGNGVPKLCYVKGSWAYFTTQNLEDQWGDDWDDAPYEHNAGDPYYPTISYKNTKDPEEWNTDGSPKWEIIKVAFDGNWDTPADIAGGNSRYSVKDINSKAVAWLKASRWGDTPTISILAGTSIHDFKRLIESGGGNVYLKDEKEEV